MTPTASSLIHTVSEGTQPARVVSELLSESQAAQYFNSEAISRAKNQNFKSREILIYMPPEQFLNLVQPLPQGTPVEHKIKRIRQIIQDGGVFESLPQIRFEHDGEGTARVFSHEGRHRAYFLKQQGVRKMPVVFWSVGGGGGMEIRWGSQDNRHDRIEVWPEILRGQAGHSGNFIEFPVERQDDDVRIKSPYRG